jgi:hypothetical protein
MQIKLTEAVRVGSTEVAEITLRDRVVSGDLRGVSWRKLESLDHDAIMTIGGRLAGQPDVVMQGLVLTDALRVVEAVVALFGTGPLTGRTPSP